MVLRYELARRSGEVGKLKVDQGWINVQVLPQTYRVATRKWLLFDHDVWAAGGQTLAAYACRLGWLDYSVNQFTECTKGKHPDNPDPDPGPGAGMTAAQARFAKVLDHAEERARTCARELVAEVDDCTEDVRTGTATFDDHVAR